MLIRYVYVWLVFCFIPCIPSTSSDIHRTPDIDDMCYLRVNTKEFPSLFHIQPFVSILIVRCCFFLPCIRMCQPIWYDIPLRNSKFPTYCQYFSFQINWFSDHFFSSLKDIRLRLYKEWTKVVNNCHCHHTKRTIH